MDSKSTRSGFTLIELLVVIAIIAILAAILFPIYTAAKQNGQMARCLAHEKELSAALAMYTDDYGGRLPRDCFLTYSVKKGKGLTGLYAPYVKNKDILICQKKGAYGYNSLITGTPGKGTGWIGGAIKYRIFAYAPKDSTGRLLASIREPKRVMAFLCAKPTKVWEEDLADVDIPNGWDWQLHDLGDEYAQKRMINVHNGGTTYAFLDGHCQCLKPTGIEYGFTVPTDGLDYDGNGTIGTVDILR